MGGFGNDTLIGGRDDDYLDGGCGDDYIRIDRGNDTIDGGLGFDVLDYSWWVHDSTPDGLNINLEGGFVLDFTDGEDFISNIEHVIGPDGNDTIVGGIDAESREGGDGDDIISGGEGTDTLKGDGGADTFRISAGSSDIIVDFSSVEEDMIDLREWPDFESFAEIEAAASQVGDDLVIDLGAGHTLTFRDLTISSLDVDDFLFAGVADADTVRGSDAEDFLRGSGSAEHFRLGAGHDKLFGGAGHDRADGGKGRDTIGGGTGNDTIFGGSGNDLIFGGKGSGDSDDVLNGEAGNDTIHGGSGSDSVIGGDGADLLFGGAGDDVLVGGAGADVFFFGGDHGDDVITDFDAGEDVLFLRNADVGFANVAAVQAAASETTIDGVSGVLIDTGGGNGIFLEGASLADLTASTIAL